MTKKGGRLTETHNVLVLKLHVVFDKGELDPYSAFTCIYRLPNPYVVADLVDAFVSCPSLVENRVIAVVRISLTSF